MSNALPPANPNDQLPDRSDDLADRLVRLRSRIEREGRKAALERIDRAIDEARTNKRAQR